MPESLKNCSLNSSYVWASQGALAALGFCGGSFIVGRSQGPIDYNWAWIMIFYITLF